MSFVDMIKVIIGVVIGIAVAVAGVAYLLFQCLPKG